MRLDRGVIHGAVGLTGKRCSASDKLAMPWRALVEADASRWKRVLGDGLRSRTEGRRATEVAIAARALNRMLELGRPEYVRLE